MQLIQMDEKKVNSSKLIKFIYLSKNIPTIDLIYVYILYNNYTVSKLIIPQQTLNETFV